MTDHDSRTDPILLTVSEAAARAGVTRQAMHGWIVRGRLRPVLTDDGFRIEAAELGRLLAARRAAQAAGIKLDTVLTWAQEASDEGA